jgi:hypothetical protein
MAKQLISENTIRKINLIEYRRSVRVLKEEVDNRLKQVCFKQFDRLLLKNCEQITHPNYPDRIFFKRKIDGKIIVEIDKENERFYLDYNNVWLFFENIFNLKYEEIQEIARDWLDNTFKLRGYGPRRPSVRKAESWMRLSN